MNKSYRSIWNESLGAWVAASEVTSARGKRSGSLAVIAAVASVLIAGAGLDSAHAQVLGGSGATATGADALAAGKAANASGASAVAIGPNANSLASSGVALGSGATVGLAADAGVAIGGQSSVASGATSGIALGRGAATGGAFGIAQGDGANAVGTNSIAVGLAASTRDNGDVAIGANSAATGRSTGSAVAIGRAAKALAGKATAIGAGALANSPVASFGSTAIGYEAKAVSDATDKVFLSSPTAVGTTSAATSDGAVAFGEGSNASALYAQSLGSYSGASASGAIAVGGQAKSTAENAIALGFKTQASTANSVALGAGAVTAAPNSTGPFTQYGAAVAGTPVAANGVVSVGAAGKERQIQNVAAGVISQTSTDAVNGSQLNAVVTGVNKLGASAAKALGGNATYDPATGNVAGFSVPIGKVDANGSTAAAPAQTTVGDALTVLDANQANAMRYIKTAPGGSMTAAVAGNAGDVAIGVQANATSGKAGDHAGVAIGYGSTMSGNRGVAVGMYSNATGDDAVAYGYKATASAAGAAALGADAKALQAGSVALGQGSVADRANVVSVGNVGAERQIVNVADGNVAAGSKDAVNGGQLNTVNETANKGWNLSANGEGTPRKIAPGDTVDFINGSNTIVSRTGNRIQVDVSKTPTFESVTVTNGTPGNPGASATLGANGLTTKGADGTAGPSVTGAGIDAGGKPLANVGAGSKDTDAANVAQVKEAQAKADNAVQYDKNADGTPGKDGITLGGLNADGTPATAPVKLANVADGNVAAGSKDAINGGQLNTTNQNITNLGNDVRTGAIGPVQAAPGKTGQLTLVAPGATGAAPGNAQVLGNVAAGTAPTDAVNRGQLDALAGSAVQYDKNADGTPRKDSITLGGLNTDGSPATPVKLGNVADGNVAAGSKDAVNGGQLNAVSETANKGWNLSANGIAAQKIAPGDTVDFVDGSNTTVTRTNNQIKVDVSKTPTFDSVTVGTGAPGTGSATLGANGLTTKGADGAAGPSVTTAGIDAGGKPLANVGAGTNGTDAANVDQVKAVEAKADSAVQYDKNADGTPGKDGITLGGLNADGTPATAPVKLGNVADGSVAAGSKDAVNGGQLNAVSETANKGWNLSANGADAFNVAPGGKVDFVNGSNTLVSRSGNQIMVDVSRTPVFESVTASNGTPGNPGASATLGANGLTTKGADGASGPSVTATGIDAAGKPIANVGAGEKDTDAASVGQLKAMTASGGNSVQYDDGGRSAVTLGGVDANGAPAGAPVKLGNVAAGTAPTDAVNRGQLDALAGSAVQYDKNADGTPGKDGITLGGLGADGSPASAPVKLGNVADGEVAAGSKDAVNGGQLNAVSETANKGWNLSANGEGTPQKIAPGDTVDFINGSNTTVSRTGNQIQVDVSKTPTFDSVTVGSGVAGTPGTGSTTLGANGLTTIGTDGKAGPSVTGAGIDAGGKPLTNVGAGTKDTDAANMAQVKEAQAKAGNAVQYDPTADGTPGKDSITLGGVNADGSPAAPVKLGNVADGNVVAGSKDAVNGGQLDTTNQNITTLGDNIAAGTVGSVQAVPGKTDQLTLVAPGATGSAPGNAQVLGNVAAGTAPTDAVNRGQLDALAGSAVQYDKNADGTQGKDGITLGGLGADGSPASVPVKLGNVADGEVAAGSKDAVNGGQLNAVSETANKGWNLSANGEGTPQKIAPGDTVDFINGSNTTVSRTGNRIQVDVSKTPNFDSVTVGSGAPGTAGTGSATLGANGLTTIGTDGKAGPSVTGAGIDAAGKPITNVGAGTNGTDAANVDQVNAVQAKADNAVQYDKNADGTPGKESITLGGLDADGKPAAAPVKLANVADGNVAAGSKDAVNGGQLNTLGTGIGNVLGGSYTNGVYTPPTFVTVGGGTATTVQGALDNLGAAVAGGAVGPVQQTGKDGQLALVAPGAIGAAPGAPQQLTNVKNGELSSTSSDAVNGSQLHAVSEAVAAVGTKADNALQYDKGADGAPGKSSITLGGTGADGKTPSTDPVKLGNVADGNVAAGSKDAVNGGQLFTTNQNVTNLGNDLKNLSTNINDGKVGPLQRTGKADELVLVGKDATADSPGAAQRVTNVANGTKAGDAVNFGQLQEVASTANNSLQYDGADKRVATMGGAASTDGGKTGGTRLGNVAQGAVNDKSTDAVNGAQLAATNTAVSNALGGGANLNEGKAPSYTVQGNTYDNVGGALGSVNDNLSTVNSAINGGGIKYFRANSALPDADASGTDAVAVGPQAVAGGASSVAVGSGAQATSASGTAIGFKAVVQQMGGVALGAGSVASTASGVAGYVPEGAGAQQAAAVRATTGTQGAVSVGDAGNGQFRQITGVAAGTADSDAANVAQLKASASAARAGSVQYDTNADGTPNYGQITMGNGQAPDGTRISNVAPGVQGNDAVNVNQLNGATALSMNYTDARVNQLGHALQDVAKKSYAGTAAAMAMETAPYIAGKVTYAAGMGHYQGQTAVGASLRKTAESGRWSVSGGVTATSAGTVGVRAGISGVWD
jgi:autotransporter adhesin